MRTPLAAPLVAFAGGVFAARLAAFAFWELAFAAALLAALSLVGLRARGLGAGLAACLCGFGLSGAALASIAAKPDPQRIDQRIAGISLDVPARLVGWVARPPEHFEEYDRFVLSLEEAFDGQPTSGGVRVAAAREPDAPPLELEYGQRLEFLARLRRLDNYDNPGAFDQTRFLQRKGIFAQASLRNHAPIVALDGGRGSPFQSWLWTLRRAASQRLESLLDLVGQRDSEAGAILRAMLLGDRQSLTRETELSFQRTGAYHALVVSGLHVGVIAAAVLMLFRLLAVPRLIGAVLTMLLAAAYAFLLDTALPVSRAAWMLAAYFIAMMVYRQRRPLNTLAAVGLLFLALDPAQLREPGFQLSFGAVGLIVGIAAPLLERTVEPYRRTLIDIRNQDRDMHLPVPIAERRVALRNWLDPLAKLSPLPEGATNALLVWPLRLLCWAAAIFTVSAIIQLGLAAPLAWHFQRLSVSGPLVNLAVMPMIGLLVPLGALGLASGWSAPLAVAAALADLLARIVAWAAQQAGWDWRVPPPPEWLFALSVAALAGWALAFPRGRPFWLAGAGAAGGCFALIAWHPFPPQVESGKLELTAIDVGQAESLHLVLPNRESVLVDAGGFPSFGKDSPPQFDVGEAVVTPYLWSRSIQRLDVLAITHMDADHSGGAAAILENFAVEDLWIPRAAPREEFAELIAAAERKQTLVRRLAAGEEFLRGGVRFLVLGPGLDNLASSNDRSLALLVRYEDVDFLLSGDVERAGERALLERLPPSSGGVLKVAHHGSRTSTDPAVLERFRPAVALISAGVDSVFGHPHEEVLERLRERRILPLSTSWTGMISVLTDGRRLEIRR